MTDGAPAPVAQGELRPHDGGITPSQTVGPFFAYVLTPHAYPQAARQIFSPEMATPDAVGHRIRIEGYVLDGDGEPVIDAMVEFWQADGDGRYVTSAPEAGRNAAFTGFGRSDVDSNGFFAFSTVLPGSVPGPNGSSQAPHIDVGVFARGLLRRLFTRIYFEGESRNTADPILALVPADRRDTLIAKKTQRGSETVYSFNIRLQGEGETVFFQG